MSGFTKTVKLLTSTKYSGLIEDILLGKNRNVTFEGDGLKLIVVKAIEYINTTIIDESSQAETELEFMAKDNGILSLINLIKTVYSEDKKTADSVLETMRIYDLQKPLMKNVGLGRIGYLTSNIKISEIISKMKTLLKQNTFRLALANGMTISMKFFFSI